MFIRKMSGATSQLLTNFHGIYVHLRLKLRYTLEHLVNRSSLRCVRVEGLAWVIVIGLTVFRRRMAAYKHIQQTQHEKIKPMVP